MIKINSSGATSRIFAVLIGIFPIMFVSIILWLTGRSLTDTFTDVGFYFVMIFCFLFIGIHFYYNLFDHDVYLCENEVVVKRFLFPKKIIPRSLIHVESKGLVSVFFFGYVLKSGNQSYVFKKAPNNFRERLYPSLVLERIKKEMESVPMKKIKSQ